MSLHPVRKTLRERVSQFFESLGRTSLQRSAEELAKADAKLVETIERLKEKDTLGPCRTDLEVNHGD